MESTWGNAVTRAQAHDEGAETFERRTPARSNEERWTPSWKAQCNLARLALLIAIGAVAGGTLYNYTDAKLLSNGGSASFECR